MTHPEQWPLRRLVLRTPRLELRPDDDEGLRELVEVAYAGVHEPERMPFAVPWTDADPAYLGRGMLQFFWSERARFAPQDWAVHFLVRFDGRVIGTQGMNAKAFGVTREVRSGSWLGMAHQRRGFGAEMRSAMLQFAFDHLGARLARSEAFTDNDASHAVSRRLGYRADGTETLARRGEPAAMVRLRLDPADFARPTWKVQVDGIDDCRELLGAG